VFGVATELAGPELMSTGVAQPRLALTKSISSISEAGPVALASDPAVRRASCHERPPSFVVHSTADDGLLFPVSPRASPSSALMKSTEVAGGSARWVQVRPPSVVANSMGVPFAATSSPSSGDVNWGALTAHPVPQSSDCGRHVAPPSCVTSKNGPPLTHPPATHPVVVSAKAMPYLAHETGSAPGAAAPLAGVVSTRDQCIPPSTVRKMKIGDLRSILGVEEPTMRAVDEVEVGGRIHALGRFVKRGEGLALRPFGAASSVDHPTNWYVPTFCVDPDDARIRADRASTHATSMTLNRPTGGGTMVHCCTPTVVCRMSLPPPHATRRSD